MSTPAFANSNDLLRRLDPVVRPGAATSAPGASASGALFESHGFDDLLSHAMSGSIESGRAVNIASELQPPLAPDQLDRLAAAGDRSEANGAKRVLMMLDGRGLEMDIASRTIISELRPGDEARLLRVDAAMVVASPSEDSTARGSPFAGLQDLNAARLVSAAKSGAERASLAPISR